MREIVTSEQPKPDFSYHPCLWFCLDESSQYALKHVQSVDYHKKLIPPGSSYGLPDFDPVKEMRAPEEERHMKVTNGR